MIRIPFFYAALIKYHETQTPRDLACFRRAVMQSGVYVHMKGVLSELVDYKPENEDPFFWFCPLIEFPPRET